MVENKEVRITVRFSNEQEQAINESRGSIPTAIFVAEGALFYARWLKAAQQGAISAAQSSLAAAPSLAATLPKPEGKHKSFFSGLKGKHVTDFTTDGQAAMEQAQAEAREHQHAFVGTEHLLLALLDDEQGATAKVLTSLGHEPTTIREVIVSKLKPGEEAVNDEVGMTKRARKVVELAADEARRLHQDETAPTHLLLGILREGKGLGGEVLTELGVQLEQVRDEVSRLAA